MRILLLLPMIFIASLAFYGCKKSSPGSSTTTPTISTWTFNNVSYTGDSSYAGIGTIYSFDTASTSSNELDLIITSAPVNGTYTVVSGITPTDSTQIGVDVYITDSKNSSGFDYYVGSGAAGNKVTISVSSKNIVTATFSNISVVGVGVTGTGTLSGTIVAPLQ